MKIKKHDIVSVDSSRIDSSFEDDFARDANEGLASVPDWEKDVSDLQKRFNKKYGISNTPVILKAVMYVSVAAAAIVFIIMLTDYWNQNLFTQRLFSNRENFNKISKKETTINKIEKESIIEIQTKNIQSETKQSNQINEPLEVTGKEVFEQEQKSFAEISTNDLEKAESIDLMQATKSLEDIDYYNEKPNNTLAGYAATTTISKRFAKATTDYICNLEVIDYRKIYVNKIPNGGETNTGIEAKHEERKKADKSIEVPSYIPYWDYLSEAMLFYSKDSYFDALQHFNTILNFYPEDINALFYSGLIYYKTKKYSDALKQFDAILSGNIITFDEQTQWYKALTLIELNEKDKAIEILISLKNKNEFYGKKASQLLDEIRK